MLLLLNSLTGPICPSTPCDQCISNLISPRGVKMCENTGRGDFGSVIGQHVTHPDVLAEYRSVKHRSLALVATSKLYDRWILISDPSYTTAKRTLPRSYGLGETPSLDVHAIITLYPRTCNPHAADPPALRSRARAARARPDYAHAHVVHLRRTRRSMRARTGAQTQESKAHLDGLQLCWFGNSKWTRLCFAPKTTPNQNHK